MDLPQGPLRDIVTLMFRYVNIYNMVKNYANTMEK